MLDSPCPAAAYRYAARQRADAERTSSRRSSARATVIGLPDRFSSTVAPGQRGLGAGRHRHPHVLADLDVQHQAGHVGRRGTAGPGRTAPAPRRARWCRRGGRRRRRSAGARRTPGRSAGRTSGATPRTRPPCTTTAQLSSRCRAAAARPTTSTGRRSRRRRDQLGDRGLDLVEQRSPAGTGRRWRSRSAHSSGNSATAAPSSCADAAPAPSTAAAFAARVGDGGRAPCRRPPARSPGRRPSRSPRCESAKPPAPRAGTPHPGRRRRGDDRHSRRSAASGTSLRAVRGLHPGSLENTFARTS